MKLTVMKLILFLLFFFSAPQFTLHAEPISASQVSQVFHWKSSQLKSASSPNIVYRNRNGRASGRISGGGKGLRINGQLLLRDFVETGIEHSAYVDVDIDIQYPLLEELQSSLSFKPELIHMIEAKINEIYQIFPMVALQIVQVIQDYDWNLVNAHVCDPNDVGPSPLSEKNNFKDIPIVCRESEENVKLERVTFNRALFSSLPLKHQTGMFFHEAFYILDSMFGFQKKINSEAARSLTAFVFDPRFKYVKKAKFQRRLQRISAFNAPHAHSHIFTSLDNFERTVSKKGRRQCRTLRSTSLSQVKKIVQTLAQLRKYRFGRYRKPLHHWRSFPHFSAQDLSQKPQSEEHMFFSELPLKKQTYVLENYYYYKKQEAFGHYIKSVKKKIRLPRKSLYSLRSAIQKLKQSLKKDKKYFLELCFTEQYRQQLYPFSNIKVHLNNR